MKIMFGFSGKNLACIDNSSNLNHKNNISWNNKYYYYNTCTKRHVFYSTALSKLHISDLKNFLRFASKRVLIWIPQKYIE